MSGAAVGGGGSGVRATGEQLERNRLARERLMSDLITCDPKVMMGKPVVAGTRITVESIVERIGAGVERPIVDASELEQSFSVVERDRTRIRRKPGS